MTCCRLYSVLLNLPTGQVVLALMYPLSLLPASLPPGGVSSLLSCCCSKLYMFTGLLKACDMEPEKFLAALA